MYRTLFLLALVVPVTSLDAAAQTATFARDDAVSHPGARALVTADFDRNGWLDLAQANAGRNSVTILLTHRDATPARAFDVAVGTGPFALTAGDFNRDGIPDLAVTNADSHTISILIGRGNGAFTRLADIAAPTQSPRGIATADISGDGMPDLIYSGFAGPVVQVLIGNGAGGFSKGATYTGADSEPQGLATADFNHDGWLDVAVGYASGLRILYGNGGTTFTARAVAGAAHLNVVATGDFNADGWTDVAAASTATSTVAIYLGRPAGPVFAHAHLTGASPRGITAADVNGDGALDVVTANRSTSTVSVLPGDRDHRGSFLPALDVAAGAGSRAVVAADFNADGRIDLATGNEYAAATTVLTNTTALTRAGYSFSHGTIPRGDASTAGPLAVADFNRDGQPDVVATRSTDGAIVVLIGGTAVALSQPFAGAFAGVADVNADGNPDVLYKGYDSNDPVSGTRTRLMTFLGNGRGAFTASATTTLPVELWQCAAGDMDRDGRIDLVCGGYDRAARAQILRVLTGAGDGRFRGGSQVALTDNGGDVGALRLADVNRDGALDVVVIHADAEIWFGNGRGGLSSGGATDLGGIPWPEHLRVGDLNHDGRADVVVVGHAGELAIALGLDGGFGEATIATALVADGPEIADINQDGHPDIVVAAYPNWRRHEGEDINQADLAADPVLVLLGRGDGSFAPPAGFAFDRLSGPPFAVVDVTGDGLPDILSQAYDGTSVLVNERNDVNHPPSVDAPDRTVNYNDLVVDPLGPFECASLTAEALDPDHHAVTFEWRDRAGVLVTTNRVMRRCDQRPGTYPMRLTVRDGRGAVLTRTVTLTILPLKEIVVYATNSSGDDDVWLSGSWTQAADPTAAGGSRAWDPDRGAAKVAAPAASPANSVRISFTPDPTQTYKLWLRLKAERNTWGNDSVWVQFSGSTDEAGRPAYRIGTTSGLAINLEECLNCGESGWGWEDDGWGAVNRNGVTLRFPDGGRQQIVIQTREDGVSVDQVVLSSERYVTARPGLAKNDHTILPRNYHQNPH